MMSIKQILALACCVAAAATAALAPAAAAAEYPTLAEAVAAASSTNNLSTLIAAVQAAGLADSLKADTAWTIFAPTNEAFATRLQAALGITPQQLLEPSNKDTLVKVLSYHVIPSAAVLSSQLTDGQQLTTALSGAAPLTVSLQGGMVNIQGAGSTAMVTVPDIKAGKSVVHVVDDVLLPAGVGMPEAGTMPSSGRRML
ncbi:hypothetical protein OEZ86_007497 [Tetradesmus obliquus]|nr:hypothetical protein OEZ86_007497 [Tetradesmus obliquus]